MATRPFYTAASILALCTSPVLADVTPAEIWADWQEMAERYGAELSADGIEETGDALTASRVTMTMAMPEEGNLTYQVGEITFRDLGDGRVSVIMTEEMPLTMTVPSEAGGMATISMTIGHSGLEMIVSGEGDARTYDYKAAEYGVSEFIIEEPQAEEDVTLDLDARLTGLSGTFTMSGQDLIDYSSRLDAETMAVTGSGSGTDEMGQPAEFKIDVEVRGVSERSTGRFASMNPEDSPAVMVANGFALDGRFAYDASAYDFSGDAVDGPFRFAGTAEAGSFAISMGESGIAYETATGPQSLQMTGGEIPFPLSLTIAETGARLAFPIVPGEEPQGFSVSTRVVGLMPDETIWNMFDPAAQLPRAPATVVVDLSGEVILSEDIFDPAYAEDPSGPPGSVEAVALNELRLEVVGAALSGTGDFDFLQTGMMPQPVGQVDLILVGGNALIDRLVGMGLIPDEQAMGARMMLGLFARPGEGEDELTSTIEMREDGSIYANGQRLR